MESSSAAAKGETIMAKVPIHFIGFLVNVDDSITRLRLTDGCVVEKKPYGEILPFAERVRFQYGLTGTLSVALNAPDGYFCITKRIITEFEGIPAVSVIPQPFILMSGIAHVPRNQLRLLRLFKEGNAVMRYACLYCDKGSGIEITNVAEEWLIGDSTVFSLTEAEIPEARSFLEKYRLPLQEPFVQLAFQSFDLSYEIHDAGLAFLSLMTAMEVLLGPKDGRQVKHLISQNAAKLLGNSQEKGEEVCSDTKELYRKRSELVHTGDRSLVSREDILKLRKYVREAIKETLRSGMSKDALLRTLNTCGFGERPWRMNR